MLYGHGNFGQVLMSNTGTSKTRLKFIPEAYALFFFFGKKSEYVADTVVMHRNVPTIAKLYKNKNKNKREREREREMIWTIASLFPSIL